MQAGAEQLGEQISDAMVKVQAEFSRETNPDYGIGMRALGESIYDENAPVITYDGRQGRARKCLQDALLGDLRFEHLKDDAAENLTWQYVRAVGEDSGMDEEIAAISSAGKDPRRGEFWFWLERFTTSVRFNFSGVDFVPPADYHETIEREDQAEGTLIVVNEFGTNADLMRSRARKKADTALRRLRVVLDEDREIHPDQLRFYVGHRYGFSDGMVGVSRIKGTPLHLGIGEAQASSTSSHLFGTLSLEPKNDVERQIEIATNWLDRAFLADETEIAMLYRFFALEALFTNKKNRAGLGKLITIRRATMGLLVENRYMPPFYKPHLYNKVRSRAVHGEASASFPPKLADSLAWDTRRALLEYANFVSENEFTERWKVLDALDESPKRATVLETLKHNDPDTWAGYE
ncbi:MAG: hypothetical protein ACRDKI_08370 [Solirubrobacterales bacterium]